MKRTKYLRKKIRHYKIRKRISGTPEKPRLCVHKSLKHIYVTVLDDVSRPEGSVTLLNMTTNTKENKAGKKKSFRNIESATKLGEAVGKALLEKNIKTVVFDRAGYKYHGCVKAVAESARKAGVKI